jgi:hypothetical protein
LELTAISHWLALKQFLYLMHPRPPFSFSMLQSSKDVPSYGLFLHGWEHNLYRIYSMSCSKKICALSSQFFYSAGDDRLNLPFRLWQCLYMIPI